MAFEAALAQHIGRAFCGPPALFLQLSCGFLATTADCFCVDTDVVVAFGEPRGNLGHRRVVLDVRVTPKMLVRPVLSVRVIGRRNANPLAEFNMAQQQTVRSSEILKSHAATFCAIFARAICRERSQLITSSFGVCGSGFAMPGCTPNFSL